MNYENLTDTELLCLYGSIKVDASRPNDIDTQLALRRSSQMWKYIKENRPQAFTRLNILWQLQQWGPEGTFAEVEFLPDGGITVHQRSRLDP